RGTGGCGGRGRWRIPGSLSRSCRRAGACRVPVRPAAATGAPAEREVSSPEGWPLDRSRGSWRACSASTERGGGATMEWTLARPAWSARDRAVGQCSGSGPGRGVASRRVVAVAGARRAAGAGGRPPVAPPPAPAARAPRSLGPHPRPAGLAVARGATTRPGRPRPRQPRRSLRPGVRDLALRVEELETGLVVRVHVHPDARPALRVLHDQVRRLVLAADEDAVRAEAALRQALDRAL